MDLQLILTIVLVTLGIVALWIIVHELRPKSKRKRELEYDPYNPLSRSVGHMSRYEDTEAYWHDRIEQAEDNVKDAQREYKDTIDDYMKWRRDKAIEEARQAQVEELKSIRLVRDGELKALQQDYDEQNNKLLAYLRKIADEDPK